LGASSAIVETPKVTDSLNAIKDSTPVLHPHTSSFDSFTSLTTTSTSSPSTIRLEVQLGNYVPSDDYKTDAGARSEANPDPETRMALLDGLPETNVRQSDVTARPK